MVNRSEDEWSLVSEDAEVLSDSSFDEVEPQPEIQVKCDSEVKLPKAETTTETETADVLSLLNDTERSRATPPPYPTPANSPKPTVKLAFIEPEVRPKSFPERLRATTATFRPVLEDAVSPPTFTEVTPFQQDQSTQVNFDAAATELHDARAKLLRAALGRSMSLTSQLRLKSQDHERLSFRIADLESVAIQTEEKTRRYATKIKMNERSLALAKQRATLNTEYQENLKTIAEDLRQENSQLTAQNAALCGKDDSLAARSLDDLEELETMLVRGMENVRAALRSKYRAALENRREKEVCLVCCAKPVSVVLLPCRHQVLCASCALRVTSCPVDRTDIQDKVLTYGLNAYTNSDN
ncbi:hypothetical protein PHMEG_00034629 [Phytophthora megakarya]|uniref:RING-type domain-containing protein n=1 Tax=Phytophthora megakarya TaxID=4795 RepID=A0A225UR09_9STRA|nr:hypothetical protein PHMEG_00034629 [Phytophthora megakarya]